MGCDVKVQVRATRLRRNIDIVLGLSEPKPEALTVRAIFCYNKSIPLNNRIPDMGNSSLAVHSNNKYLHFAVGAAAAAIIVYVSGLYFRPSESGATEPPPFVQYDSYGTATVVCGAPDPLVQYLADGSSYAKKFTYGKTSGGTQVLASCSSPFGGVTKFIALRRSKKDGFISYRIKIDGASTPLIDIYSAADRGKDSIPMQGWSFGETFVTTTLPIKFKSSLVIEAEVRGSPSIETPSVIYTGAHVMFEPLISEEALPVRFLKPQEIKFEPGVIPTVNVGNAPTVNVGNTPTVNIGGQPIQIKQ